MEGEDPRCPARPGPDGVEAVKTPTGIRKDGSLSRSTSRSVGRSFWATGVFLKEQLWVWPEWHVL
jgi:hypothetical protein